MNFWQYWQTASGLGGMQHWLLLGFCVIFVSLWIFVPVERRRLRLSLALIFLAYVTLFLCAAMLARGANQSNPLFRWMQGAAWLVEGIAVINVASLFLFEVLLNAVRIRPPRILRDLLVALAYAIFLLTLLSRDGVDLTGIIATSAVITAVIGLSFQDTLGNVMGGLALQMERTVNTGDWVRVDNTEGRVKEIRWRQTSIETRDGNTIVIPNSVLMKSQVMLIGQHSHASRQQRRWVYFNVDFRYAPSDVIEAVQTVLRGEPLPCVAETPPPDCILFDYKDSYAAYAVRYWLTDFNAPDPTDSAVRTRIYFALRRAGIPLSMPAAARFITAEDESRRERKTNKEIKRRCDAVRNVSLFQTLTEEELRELADYLHLAPFMRGEFITRQGNTAHWLYIIRRGEAEIRLNAPDGNLSEPLKILRDGDFFGEMGLMTGEPRTANVIARTNVECYKLEKDAFDTVLKKRPEIAEDISKVLAQRRIELEAFSEELTEEAKRQQMNTMQNDLLHRIRAFFRL